MHKIVSKVLTLLAFLVVATILAVYIQPLEQKASFERTNKTLINHYKMVSLEDGLIESKGISDIFDKAKSID